MLINKKISIVYILVCFIVCGCTSVQIWELNQSIPHNDNQPKRIQFYDRMSSFYKIHGVVDEPKNWFVVNETNLLVKVPFSYNKEFIRKIPLIACNPRGDMDECILKQ